MIAFRSVASAILPSSVRHFLREQHRQFVFGRAMKRFSKNPEKGALDSALLADLIYGWGNEQWSALDEYLKACLQVVFESKGPVLECGSGLSTVLMGIASKRTGNTLWALEHHSAWGDRVQGALNRFGVSSVHLLVAPLRKYDDFDWYNPPLTQMPDNFGGVICDGPPGDTRGGRFGLLPVMKSKMQPGCVILLDDAARDDEQAILRRWSSDMNMDFEMCGRHKPYARMTTPIVSMTTAAKA